MLNPTGAGKPCTDADREMVRPVLERYTQTWFEPGDLPYLLQNDDIVSAAKSLMKYLNILGTTQG